VGLTTPHIRKHIVTRVEQRKKPDRFIDDGRIRTGNTKITKVISKVQTAKPGRMKEIMKEIVKD
jgi:hypothetical protein